MTDVADETELNRQIIRPFFDKVEELGGGTIRCLRHLGIIQALIKGEWQTLSYYRQKNIMDVAIYKRMRIKRGTIKVISAKYGVKYTFVPRSIEQLAGFGYIYNLSLIGRVNAIDRRTGAYGRSGYRSFANCSFISYLKSGNNVEVFDENGHLSNRIDFPEQGPHKYTRVIKACKVANILFIGKLHYIEDCETVSLTDRPDTIIINGAINRLVDYTLYFDDGSFNKHLIYLSESLAINNRQDYALPEYINIVYCINGIFIGCNYYHEQYEQVHKRAPPDSGKRTKLAHVRGAPLVFLFFDVLLYVSVIDTRLKGSLLLL